MRKNRFREILRRGGSTIGTHVYSTWPALVEIIGRAGVFDYVEFVGENAEWTLHELDDFARATELWEMSSMMKVEQESRGFIAQRALGSGIQSILFADVRTVEETRECVRIVRAETPQTKGKNGCFGRRNVGYIFECGTPAYVQAMDDVVVALMVEKKQTVDNLEEILSVEGIDMVNFGRCDYAMSIGHPGERSHPKVKEAEFKTIRTALNMGVHPRVEISRVEEAQKYVDLGVRHFCFGYDLAILYQHLKKGGENLQRILCKVSPQNDNLTVLQSENVTPP